LVFILFYFRQYHADNIGCVSTSQNLQEVIDYLQIIDEQNDSCELLPPKTKKSTNDNIHQQLSSGVNSVGITNRKARSSRANNSQSIDDHAQNGAPPPPLPKPRWTVTASPEALAMDKEHRKQEKTKEALVILVVSFVVAIVLQYFDDLVWKRLDPSETSKSNQMV
jgi:hypothetical protein